MAYSVDKCVTIISVIIFGLSILIVPLVISGLLYLKYVSFEWIESICRYQVGPFSNISSGSTLLDIYIDYDTCHDQIFWITFALVTLVITLFKSLRFYIKLQKCAICKNREEHIFNCSKCDSEVCKKHVKRIVCNNCP